MKNISLKKYDNKYVRIIDLEDKIFEGLSNYSNKEYNECEYGRNEESIDILNIKFYKFCIKKIEIIDNFNSNEYSDLEELIIDSDIDFIEDAFDYEDKIHNDRLILCIKDHMDKFDDINRINKLIEKYSK